MLDRETLSFLASDERPVLRDLSFGRALRRVQASLGVAQL